MPSWRLSICTRFMVELTCPQPLYFSTAKASHSLVQTGVCLLAWTLPIALFAFLGFFAITKLDWLRPVTWFGWFLVVLGIALMTVFTRDMATVMWTCIAVFSGSGVGLLYPSLSISSVMHFQSGAEEGKLSSAVINFAFFQILGQTLGVAVGTTIFQNQLYKQFLANPVLTSSALRSAKESMFVIISIQKLSTIENTLKTEVIDSYAHSLRLIWVVMAAMAGAAMIASFFVRNVQVKRNQDLEVKTLTGASASVV
jgi:hypothetical protein